jgi:hypothetical protein
MLFDARVGRLTRYASAVPTVLAVGITAMLWKAFTWDTIAMGLAASDVNAGAVVVLLVEFVVVHALVIPFVISFRLCVVTHGGRVPAAYVAIMPGPHGDKWNAVMGGPAGGRRTPGAAGSSPDALAEVPACGAEEMEAAGGSHGGVSSMGGGGGGAQGAGSPVGAEGVAEVLGEPRRRVGTSGGGGAGVSFAATGDGRSPPAGASAAEGGRGVGPRLPSPPVTAMRGSSGGASGGTGGSGAAQPAGPLLLRTVRYCSKCKGPKPPRAHHCSSCGVCVLKMDHHCPWIANCVGLHNYKYGTRPGLVWAALPGSLGRAPWCWTAARGPWMPPPPSPPRPLAPLCHHRYFYLFVLYGFLSCVVLCIIWLDVLFIRGHGGADPGAFVFIAFFVAVSFALSLGMFVALHTYIIVTGRTTVEMHGR